MSHIKTNKLSIHQDELERVIHEINFIKQESEQTQKSITELKEEDENS